MKCVYQIKLYFNENEQKSKELMKIIEGIPVDCQEKDAVINYKKTGKKELSHLMQNVLKDEWNRVRDGEILWSFNNFFRSKKFTKNFYISRICIFLVIVLVVIGFISYFISLVWA